MLKMALSAGVIAILSLVLVASSSPPRVQAASFIVTSSADSGTGSFRAAIEQANNSSSNNQIILANWSPITLLDTVEYTNYRNLSIVGNGISNRVIQGEGFDPNGIGEQTDCALFESTGGADLSITRVTFQNTPCNGIEVYGSSGDGEIAVTLNTVTIRNMGGTGLYLEEGGGGSDASWNLKMTSSRVEYTGYYDLPAVNVEEYSDGNVTVNLASTSIVHNYWEGLNLDEDDYGQLLLNASNSYFNGNGDENEEIEFETADEEDVAITDHTDGDGIDAEECGDGDLTANLSSVQANENFEDGIDLFECGDGHLRLTGTSVIANYNETENGIQTDEEDWGDGVTRLTNARTSYNGDDGVDLSESGYGNADVRVSGSQSNSNDEYGEDGDGYEIEEFGEGNLIAAISTTVANNNADNGFFLGENDEGDLNATLTSTTANNNQDEGFDFEEWGDGAFAVQVISSFAQGNGDSALEADAEGGDPGTIRLTGSTLIGNIDLDNVNEI
jgi:hypothetical protein